MVKRSKKSKSKRVPLRKKIQNIEESERASQEEGQGG